MQVESKRVKDTVAARFMGLSVQTLRNWRSKGIGPSYIKIGKTVRYDVAELENFIDRHRVETDN